jgi:antitoxin (DNA-binding transcriptional repressor) of toxin-antitoxin stability system
MKRFGLRKANQHFARLVRTLRNGEDVLLLDRGKPLAVVKPIGAGENG